MTLTEVCLVAIAASATASSVALIGTILHLRVTSRLLEGLIRDTSQSVRRIDEVAAELRSLTHRADRDYQLASDTARLALSEAVLPVKGLASLIWGIRAGLGAFFRPRRQLSHTTHDERGGT